MKLKRRKKSSKKKNTFQRHNNPNRKKYTTKKSKMTKSVFLYGNPNVEKREILKTEQENYTNAINYYILYLYDLRNYGIDTFISILNNATHSPLLRAIEKKLQKDTHLKSALSQAAFDEAVNKVSNQFVAIKGQIYTVIDDELFVSSKILYTMAIYDCDKSSMYKKIEDLIKIKKDELKDTLKDKQLNKNELSKSKIKTLLDNIMYYEDLLKTLNDLSEDTFNSLKHQFRGWYKVISTTFKCPYCEKSYVRLTSAAFSLQESKNIKEPYVIAITTSASNKRIEIPLRISGRGLKRFEKYKVASSVAYTIRNDGSIKVDIAVEKEVDVSKEITEYKGVDTGISDLFHTSDGKAIGHGVMNEIFYKIQVEPALAEINKLKMKKRKIKKYLHEHKEQLTDLQIKQMRDKMDHIETNIRKNKKAKKLLNKYHNENDRLISQSCKEYIKSLGKDKSIMTVLEKLDIKEFNRSKHDNSMHSMFVRGQLQKRLMEMLNWKGYQFMEVEPTFTSQTCPICGYLHKENRKEKDFKCQCCGYKDDADHVGALNIKSRATDEEMKALCEKYKYNQKERHNQIIILQSRRHKKYMDEHQNDFENTNC